VCYIGLGSNDYFVIGATLTGGHFRTIIISSVGHLRLDSVMPLVLYMVAYNIGGTSVILQVSRDRANLAKNG
jgi:hypothetical protein